jgi:antagonist of KipI
MSLKIIKAGIFDTIQDLGRYGFQHLGINPGGAIDRFSTALANALLGKELNSPVIEIHFPAPQILLQNDCIICLAGANFTPGINGNDISLHQPVAVKGNSILSFERLKSGARCYLSFLNELAIEKWLKSYSTNTKAGAGGYKGRRLIKDDELKFSSIMMNPLNESFVMLPWKYGHSAAQSNEIEFLPGHEWKWLTTKSQTDFLNGGFVITTASDRMGYRLQGDLLEQKNSEQLVSSGVSFGTVQLLPSRQIIILMADHQTTGGYPRVADVVSTDLSKLAQMKPGEEIKFVMTDVALAEEKLLAQQTLLHQLQNNCNLKMQNWLNAH